MIGSEYGLDVALTKPADGYDDGMNEKEELKMNSKFLPETTE